MLTKARFLQFGSLVAPTFAALVLGGCSAPGVSHEDVLGTASSLTLAGVTLQTVLVPRFVGAANNGGGAVNATATVAQAWETFTFQDINGGALMSGDSVFIQAGNGQYFQALNGGGSTLNAGSNNQLAWETFKVVSQSGKAAVSNGDIVGLQDNAGSWVSAANGGGAAVFAYGGALGSWEQFKINGLPAVVALPTPTPTPTPPSSTTIGNVSFRTALQSTYVGAQNNGGGAVIATATAAQAWETFSLIDVNGGDLNSGDSVYVKAGNGQYFQALNGGGSSLNAGSNNTQAWETFKVVEQSGSGMIKTGDIVGLQASTGSWVSAANGGGGSVFAYGGALGSWERFVFTIGATGSGGGGGGGGGGGTVPPVAGPPATHVACVGDSITEGFGASSPAKYYPAQLQGLLGNSVQVRNFGHSGTTMLGPGYGDSPYVQTYEYTAATDFVSNAGANAVVSVIIMLGANDSKPSNWEPAGKPKNDQQYLTDYRAMVDHFLGLPTKPTVYVAFPSATGNNPCCTIRGDVIHDQEIPLIKQLAIEKQVPIIDLNTPTQNHPEYFGDGVHPTDAGYGVLAQLVQRGLAR